LPRSVTLCLGSAIVPQRYCITGQRIEILNSNTW
jgi:hypothetical protein